MSILGLGDAKDPAKKTKKSSKKDDSNASNSQADEAKALLEKMEAKKDAGDCPFC